MKLSYKINKELEEKLKNESNKELEEKLRSKFQEKFNKEFAEELNKFRKIKKIAFYISMCYNNFRWF